MALNRVIDVTFASVSMVSALNSHFQHLKLTLFPTCLLQKQNYVLVKL